jgi:hypothetical protein
MGCGYQISSVGGLLGYKYDRRLADCGVGPVSGALSARARVSQPPSTIYKYNTGCLLLEVYDRGPGSRCNNALLDNLKIIFNAMKRKLISGRFPGHQILAGVPPPTTPPSPHAAS